MPDAEIRNEPARIAKAASTPGNTRRRFRALCTLAELHGFREECRAGRCRAVGKCTGGPRGTFSRFGIPACLLREWLLLGGGGNAQEAIAGALLKRKPPVRLYRPSAHPWNELPATRPKPQDFVSRKEGPRCGGEDGAGRYG